MTGNAHRIKSVSHIFKSLFKICFLLVPILVAVFWLGLNSIHDVIKIHPFTVATYPISFKTQLLGMVSSMLSASCVMYIMFKLSTLFSFYEMGKIFTTETVGCYKRISLATIAYAPLGMMSSTFTLWMLSDFKRFEITFSTSEIGVLILGSIVLLISWIMEEACRLKTDNDLTI
jgi:hypothetical protein